MNDETKRPPEFGEDEMHMHENTLPPEINDHQNRVGLILGLLIILLILILGGLYLWYSTAFMPKSITPPEDERFVPEMPYEPEMQNTEAEVQKLNTVSTSNEIDAIEADIESTDLEQIDAELNAIDAELNSEI